MARWKRVIYKSDDSFSLLFISKVPVHPGPRICRWRASKASIRLTTKMPDTCSVYECSNRSNREVDKIYFRVPKEIVHKGAKCREYSQRRAKWLANLSLRSEGIDRVLSKWKSYEKATKKYLVPTELRSPLVVNINKRFTQQTDLRSQSTQALLSYK